MQTWIALLRGINVGGHRKLPMKELREIAESVGGAHVKTYIQSGNLAFAADSDLRGALAGEIESRRGFRPMVMTLTLSELEAAVEANPFPEAEAEPKTLHLFFFSDRPAADAAIRLEEARSTEESFLLTPSVLFLHSPALLSGSKIAPVAERILGVPTTARNWRSTERLLELARGVEALRESD